MEKHMEKNYKHKKSPKILKAFPAFLVMLGLFGAGFFPGYYYYQSKINANYVTVKGLAEMDVKADLAVWDLRFTVTGDDLALAQKSINSQLASIREFLNKNAINDKEIIEGRIETTDLAANPYLDKVKSRYILTQNVTVRSNDVYKIDAALRKSGELLSKGVALDSQQYSSPVSYIFTNLNSVKAKMLEEATKNAAISAEEFAKRSNSEVGKIKYANQGVFSILPREQTVNSSEMQQIDKKIRVVVTVDYWLK